ncbi:hypothetical protein U1Q18_027934 [Sarracenia purpurea var. burkii]
MSVWVEKRSTGAVKEEVDTHPEVKMKTKVMKEVWVMENRTMDFQIRVGPTLYTEKGDCEQVEDANQGLGAIQVSLPDSSPACEAGVYTDSERRLSLALEDIREGDNGDENFYAHHMNSNFVPDLGKEGNAGYVAVSEIQGLVVPLSKTQVGVPRPPTGLAPRPSVAQGELNSHVFMET